MHFSKNYVKIILTKNIYVVLKKCKYGPNFVPSDTVVILKALNCDIAIYITFYHASIFLGTETC